MKKLTIITIIAFIVCAFVSYNAYAGNDKTQEGSGINPAGMSDKNGFDNGNAWWKGELQSCMSENISLEDHNADLYDEINDLYDRIEELEAALAEKDQPMIMMSTAAPIEETIDAEPRKLGIYHMGEDHPNTPGAYGVQANFFIPADYASDLIDEFESGTYEVTIVIVDPHGNKLNVKALANQARTPRDYYETYVGLIR